MRTPSCTVHARECLATLPSSPRFIYVDRIAVARSLGITEGLIAIDGLLDTEHRSAGRGHRPLGASRSRAIAARCADQDSEKRTQHRRVRAIACVEFERHRLAARPRLDRSDLGNGGYLVAGAKWGQKFH